MSESPVAPRTSSIPPPLSAGDYTLTVSLRGASLFYPITVGAIGISECARTLESIGRVLDDALGGGCITKQGTHHSLKKKLIHAIESLRDAQFKEAANELRALEHEMEAQGGRGIASSLADALIGMIEDLILPCVRQEAQERKPIPVDVLPCRLAVGIEPGFAVSEFRTTTDGLEYVRAVGTVGTRAEKQCLPGKLDAKATLLVDMETASGKRTVQVPNISSEGLLEDIVAERQIFQWNDHLVDGAFGFAAALNDLGLVEKGKVLPNTLRVRLVAHASDNCLCRAKDQQEILVASKLFNPCQLNVKHHGYSMERDAKNTILQFQYTVKVTGPKEISEVNLSSLLFASAKWQKGSTIREWHLILKPNDFPGAAKQFLETKKSGPLPIEMPCAFTLNLKEIRDNTRNAWVNNPELDLTDFKLLVESITFRIESTAEAERPYCFGFESVSVTEKAK